MNCKTVQPFAGAASWCDILRDGWSICFLQLSARTPRCLPLADLHDAPVFHRLAHRHRFYREARLVKYYPYLEN